MSLKLAPIPHIIVSGVKNKYLMKAYMIRVITINSEQMPAPTNTTSSNEPSSQVLSSDLAFVGPLPPGLLTFYIKERKSNHRRQDKRCSA